MAAANLQLLTELGRVLGCTPVASQKASLPESARGGLPQECYYSGAIADLGPAPLPSVRLSLAAPVTAMDREAAELRRRGDEGLLRFFQQIAMRRRRS